MVMRYTEVSKMAGRSTYRIDTSALKHQVERKLGHQRSQKYFNLLSQYLSCKITKSDFTKLCISLIGRENLRLHNLLIQAIIKNASLTKSPPPKEREKEAKVPYAFPQSLRKARTHLTRDSKSKDRVVICENNNKYLPKVQEQQSISLEDGEEVEQASGSSSMYSRSPFRAPFGIFINGKEPRKVLRSGLQFSSPTGSCLSKGELPDANSLKIRLEQRLEMEGLKISTDCVSLLISSLDVYLKRLINPCLQLASARSGVEKHNEVVFGLNGLRPVRYVRKQSGTVYASLLDFRVAMESNSTRLGEDWPEQLEKVCLRVADYEQ